jgi:hypothetical protein
VVLAFFCRGLIGLAVACGAGSLSELFRSGAKDMAKVTIAGLMAKLKEQRHQCAMTGRALTPETCSLDHIEPYSISKNHTLENVQLVCREVNAAKGSLSLEDFIALCREVAAFADQNAP